MSLADEDLTAAILSLLEQHPRRAMTTTEIAAHTGTPAASLTATIAGLEVSGSAVIVALPPVDRHLPPITVVAVVEGPGNAEATAAAGVRADAVAASWQRQLLAAHRCR